MIHVCDSIMGSGKTMAAINYMNTHPNNKFIYITPYLDEAERIKNGCMNPHFVEPNEWSNGAYHSKVKHTSQLIKEGTALLPTKHLNTTLQICWKISGTRITASS